jgi:hypothetical protein
VTILNNGEFAFTESVPELDSAITGSRNDLAIVGTKCNRKDIFRVTNESASASPSVDIPKSESSIPRAAECELTIR